MGSVKMVFVSFRFFAMVVFGDLSQRRFGDVERRVLKQELTLHPSTLGFLRYYANVDMGCAFRYGVMGCRSAASRIACTLKH
jgi:hypothetical protein